MKNYQYTRENYPSFRDGDYVLMYTLRVTLKHVSPKIYRKFEVPSNITLRHLADLILDLMGWSGGHLNAYHINGHHFHPAYQMTPEYGYYGGMYDNDRRQEDYTIADVLSQKGKSIELEYDFGDGWCHDVKLSSVAEYLDDEPHNVRFVKGGGTCPPEDVGGPWGYMELLEIIQKKHSHKRLTSSEKEQLEWADIDPMEFDPGYCDSVECGYICMQFSETDDSLATAVDEMVGELSEILAINREAEYTYPGRYYPSEIGLNHPEIAKILRKPITKITAKDIRLVESLPCESLAEDLRQSILCEIGIQRGLNGDELYDGGFANENIIPNALLFLMPDCDEATSWDVIMEVLKQDSQFWDFNFCDAQAELLHPVLRRFCGRHLNELFDFLLAEGYYSFDKVVLLEFLGFYANEHKEDQALIKGLLRHLLECYAKDLPECRICDGNVAAFAVGLVVDCGFENLIPQVKALYDTGLLDCSIEGTFENVVKNIKRGVGRGFDMNSTAPRDIVAVCRRNFLH